MTRTPARGETAAPDRFTALPDHQTLHATVVALEDHGFSVEVVEVALSRSAMIPEARGL
jgi:hypothetical protein